MNRVHELWVLMGKIETICARYNYSLENAEREEGGMNIVDTHTGKVVQSYPGYTDPRLTRLRKRQTEEGKDKEALEILKELTGDSNVHGTEKTGKDLSDTN